MWGFGCLIWEVHNGPLKDATELKNVDAIPQTLIPHYISLVSANPRQRPKPSILLSKARKPGSYFKNDFVDTNLFLGELAVKDKEEVQTFYQRLPDVSRAIMLKVVCYRCLHCRRHPSAAIV